MKQSFLEDVMLELIRIYWGSSVGDQARDRGGRKEKGTIMPRMLP